MLSVGLIAAVVAWAGTGMSPFGGSGQGPAPAPAQAEAPEATSRAVQAPASTSLLATVDALELYLTTPEPVVVGFHEASTVEALELTPAGRITDNENATRFEPPEDDDADTDYLVMSSRGRSLPPTSAVDVVMRTNDPVLSPVSGTVTDVDTYHLYDRHEDHRLEIAPHDQPELRVVLIHLDDLEVEEGDEVGAGDTVLAGTAREFPFSSQIDRYTEPERWPHVHVEVKHEDGDDDDAEPEDEDGERRGAS